MLRSVFTWVACGAFAAFLGCAQGNETTPGSGGSAGSDEGAAGPGSSSVSASTGGGMGGSAGATAASSGHGGAGGSGGMASGGGGTGGSSDPCAAQPQAGLGAWYRFEETTGVVCDSSGNGNHGMVEGNGFVRGVQGAVGTAIEFNGTDGRVHVPPSASLDFLSAGTIELWVRLDDVSNGVGSTVSRGTGNGDLNVLQNSSCGNMQTIFSTLTGTTNVTSNCSAIAASTWTHVAVVNDGAVLTLYLNGAPNLTQPGGYLGPIPSGLYIGRREQGVFPLTGAVDEIKWWTVVRSQAEICGDAGGNWNGSSCALP